MQTTTISISDIKLSSKYLRLETDVESLKRSIEKVGLINPLTINKENELLAGARRFKAIETLGWSEVPVHVVDRKSLEQELISIDENLVRKPLAGLEFEKCLNRGREIYEELNPLANKIDVKQTDEGLSSEEKKKLKEEEEADQDSFAAVTAEKTGLSKSVIKSAIKRDALASDNVKNARSLGTLNATKTNEIIKLDKNEQDEILPLIADKTVKEAKKIITAVKNGGIEAAYEEEKRIIPLPKEYVAIKNLSKRLNKNLSRILLEELSYEGEEKALIQKEMYKLKENLDHYFKLTQTEYHSNDEVNDEEVKDQEFNPEYMESHDDSFHDAPLV